MMPEMIPVESSNLAAAGYDEEKEELYIEFKSGGLYKYSDVPYNVFKDLLDADSKGQYFHKYIRNGGYSYERL